MITISSKGGRHRISRLTKGERLQLLLEKHDRNPSWLSRKLGVSHTLVHKWIQNKADLKLKYILLIVVVGNIIINGLFNFFKCFNTSFLIENGGLLIIISYPLPSSSKKLFSLVLGLYGCFLCNFKPKSIKFFLDNNLKVCLTGSKA